MTDRGWVDVSIDARPRGIVQVLPLTQAQVRQLKEQGHPGVPNAELERVQQSVRLSRFGGQRDQSFPVPLGDGLLWLVGCGQDATTAALRRCVATAVGLVGDQEPWSVLLPSAEPKVLRAAVEGVWLGAYCFRRSAESTGRPGPCTLVCDGPEADGQDVLARTRALCEGVVLTRDLVNAPASELGPEDLAAAARDVAVRHGMQCETWTGSELLEHGCGLVHAVGRASARPPTLTVVRVGDPDVAPALALVGKGVVFDSGGLNLKSAGSMLLMRKDMAGAGTVIGVLEALGRLGSQAPLLAVLPAAENAVGPTAYRPGDVLPSLAGKTVEIGNTDAEGRLLLADGLALARQRGARRLLDLATLTGSARVALGPDVPALFGTDEGLVQDLLNVSEQHDEPVWRLPLVEDYDRQLDTPFADMNHISSDSRGGAITAALFLRRFVEDTPWAHLDLYGWEDKGRPEAPKGGSGALVRTVTEVAEKASQA